MSYDDNRLDRRLADILHGDHPIEGDHQQKVVEIAELIELESAVSAMGNHRHTADWDWGAYITADGKEYQLAWSLEFKDPPEYFTACADADKITHIHIEGQTWSDDTNENTDLNEDILIDSITQIRWEEM